jgi:RNA polymerase sigma-70 factor, ECF subfamily
VSEKANDPTPRSRDDPSPLPHATAASWSSLVESVGPASLLVVIEGRMSVALKARMTADDVLQESLLQAWRDREKCEWRGIGPFRRWLLTIVDNRLKDIAERESRLKRGGGRAALPFDRRESDDSSAPPRYAGPVASTTPSRAAMDRETAEIMRESLEAAPEDVREVVRLRLFEELTIEETAERLGIGFSAVRHRFRRGAEAYYRELTRRLGTRGGDRRKVEGQSNPQTPLLPEP